MESINLTPTWSDLLPAMFAALEQGNEKGRAVIKAEMGRMAEAADRWNAHVKSLEDARKGGL